MQDVALTSFPKNAVAVIVGAGGGIGSALTDLLTAERHFRAVVALGRKTFPSLDLMNEPTVQEAARLAASKGELRLVIDATGFLHDEQQMPEKSWQELDAGKLARSFALNAIGPALLMKHFLPHLPRTGKSVFASLSARVGSIGDNRLGGWYAYRASKAALNQMVRTAAIELARRSPDAICVALHPGTVATPLSAPFAKNGLKIHTPSDAAKFLLNVLNRLNAESTGRFFDWRGEQIPW